MIPLLNHLCKLMFCWEIQIPLISCSFPMIIYIASIRILFMKLRHQILYKLWIIMGIYAYGWISGCFTMPWFWEEDVYLNSFSGIVFLVVLWVCNTSSCQVHGFQIPVEIVLMIPHFKNCTHAQLHTCGAFPMKVIEVHKLLDDFGLALIHLR